MFSLPPMLIGVLGGLFLTGRTINVVSLLGVIMLAGIVVNNAIVLVDYINVLRRERGMERMEAIRQACPTRLRPIMMTTLTTVLAMLPMAIGIGEGAELMAPLGTVVAAGLTFSTLITLILVPCMYIYAENISGNFSDCSAKTRYKSRRCRPSESSGSTGRPKKPSGRDHGGSLADLLSKGILSYEDGGSSSGGRDRQGNGL